MQKILKVIFLKLWIIIFPVLVAGLVTACHSSNSSQSSDKNTVKIGTIAGPETDIMKVAKAVAKKQFGLDIQIIEFTDYIEPNAALSDGSIDANLFQHQPYLDQQIQNRHYDFVVIGKTFIYPMGIYSAKIKSLQQLPEGGVVAIPNDPSNEGRALLLLQKAKLIQLKKEAAQYVMPENIIANPKKLIFKELDAAQIARSLPDVDIAAINTNYAIPAGLTPTKDALFLEDKDSLYANVIVIRKDEIKELKMKQLVAALQSSAVVKAAQAIFQGQAIPAW